MDGNYRMLFFIQEMPTTKLVNRITLGDIALDDACTYTGPHLKLWVREHPTGAIGAETPWPTWEGNALEQIAADHDLERRTWRTEPITFVKGRGYSFWVQGQISSCTSFKVRSWAHNEAKVNPGENRCDRVLQSKWRMWHDGGQSDAVPCGNWGTVPINFDSSMPGGWLAVDYSYDHPNTYVHLVHAPSAHPTPSCWPEGYGLKAVPWRPWPGYPGWLEYVCVWRGTESQFPDFGAAKPPHGWYYGFGWTSVLPGGPRDMYLRLDLDEQSLAETYRPHFLFDDDEHYRPLDVSAFFAESYPSEAYSAHHQVCSADSLICESIGSVEILADYPGDWYVDVASYASDGDEEDEENYQTPGCPQGGTLRDCDGGPTNAVYYEVNPAFSDSGYTFIDYSLFYRFDDKNDATNEDHEADLEGMTVAPSRSHPGTFDFASFAQHGEWWGYLRENLECPATANDDCPDEPAKAGARINAYVATGTHASYPDRCVNVFPGECGKNGESFPRYEADHGGERPWLANNDPLTLKPWDPAWWYWGGRWGEQRIVESPGWRRDPIVPRDNQCARDNDGCPTHILAGSASISSQARRARARTLALSNCRQWFGPSVAAIACSEVRLRKAMRRQALGDRGALRLSVQRAPRPIAAGSGRRGAKAASASAIAQLLGPPISLGDVVRIRGGVSAGTVLFLRLRGSRRHYEAVVRFTAPSRRASIQVVPGRVRPRLAVRSGRVRSVTYRVARD